MKAAIISDLHLGFSWRTERKNDSIDLAVQALQQALKEKVDLILIPGDLFDSSIPNLEVLSEFFKIFNLALKAEKSQVKLFFENRELNFSGVPIIAIHGTHEFRGKDFENMLKVLGHAEFLFYSHGNKFKVVKGTETLFVHCLGGVPEKHALQVLQKFNPKPVKEGNSKNVLLLHQSIKEFLPFEDEMVASISLENLPQGFDLIVNGHHHLPNVSTLPSGAKFCIPGSTIITQMKKNEAGKKKGFFVWETESNELEFREIENQRKLFYSKLEFSNADLKVVEDKIKQQLNDFLKNNNSELKPLIRIKLTGFLASGLNSSDLKLDEIEKDFSEKALLSISKSFSVKSLKKKIQELRDLQKSSQSLNELGFDFLEKNLNETSFNNKIDFRRLFELFENNENEKALNYLKELELKEKEEMKETEVKEIKVKEIIEEQVKKGIEVKEKQSSLKSFS
ncbi:MAG: DNA repair exonuclease [archaeon]